MDNKEFTLPPIDFRRTMWGHAMHGLRRIEHSSFFGRWADKHTGSVRFEASCICQVNPNGRTILFRTSAGNHTAEVYKCTPTGDPRDAYRIQLVWTPTPKGK